MATDLHPTRSEQRRLGRRRSRARIAALVGTLVVAVVGVAVVFTQGGEEQRTTEAVTATLRVDGEPNGLSAGADALWVALNGGAPAMDGHLERINLASGAVEESLPVTGVLSETRRNGATLWTEQLTDWMDRKPGELVERDWTTGKILGRVAFERTPFGFDFGAGSLWVVVGREPATLVRLDPGTRKPIGEPIRISSQRVIGLAFGEGAVWAAAAEDGELVRVDPASGRVDRVKVGDFPVGVDTASGSVWVANRDSGTVSRVDPVTLRVVDTIRAGNHPTFLDTAGGFVWVANQADGTVTRINASSGATVGSPVEIAPPGGDYAAAHIVAAHGDSVWVSSITQKTLSRIDAGR